MQFQGKKSTSEVETMYPTKKGYVKEVFTFHGIECIKVMKADKRCGHRFIAWFKKEG